MLRLSDEQICLLVQPKSIQAHKAALRLKSIYHEIQDGKHSANWKCLHLSINQLQVVQLY